MIRKIIRPRRPVRSSTLLPCSYPSRFTYHKHLSLAGDFILFYRHPVEQCKQREEIRILARIVFGEEENNRIWVS